MKAVCFRQGQNAIVLLGKLGASLPGRPSNISSRW